MAELVYAHDSKSCEPSSCGFKSHLRHNIKNVPMEIKVFQQKILSHYKKHGRKTLPWKKIRDPYQILVSEIMLQQTQVSRVIPKYEQFLQEFPTVFDLAKAKEPKLLSVWQGLGYWRRAKFLQRTAQEIVKNHNGKFPKNPEELVKLPGIGPYTAGAVACFAYNNADPFIDTNIRRVYLHFFFKNKKNVSDKDIVKIAEQALYKKDPRTWHYALFDYGATVLKDKTINKKSRHYNKQSKFEGSFRSFRTKAVKHLLNQPKHSITKPRLQSYLTLEIQKSDKKYTAEEVINALLKDKLIKETKSQFTL